MTTQDIIDADKNHRERAKENHRRSVDKLHEKVREIVEKNQPQQPKAE